MKSKIQIIILIFLAFGCSSGHRKERAALRDLFKVGNYDGGLNYLKQSDLAKDKDAKLLVLIEEGSLLHAAGRYYQSSLKFKQAKDIMDKLYTQSISKAVKSTLANENYEDYRGELYEQSLVYFYQSINHYMIYQQGYYEGYGRKNGDKVEQIAQQELKPRDRKMHLRAARAEILAWDSFWSTKRIDEEVKTLFKHDLLAKVYGGFIHEAMNLRSDDQIAMQLYKDALNILDKNYGPYRSFNQLNKEFKSKKSWSQTTNYKRLKDFLDLKILSLTKKLRGRIFNQVSKQINADKAVIEKAKKNKHRDNVGIVFQGGLIAQKVPDKFNIGFQGLRDKAKDKKTRGVIDRVGLPVLAMFAGNVLGLHPPRDQWSVPNAHAGMAMSYVAAVTIGISFELPMIKNDKSVGEIQIEISDSKNKVVIDDKLPLVNPMGDIAQEVVAEVSTVQYFKTGSRLALKHLSAIAGAYLTYQSLKGNNKFFAKNAAVLAYIAASKGIGATEKADTRHWATLPNQIRMGHYYLPPGDYTLKAKVLNAGPSGLTKSGEFLHSFKVTSKKEKTLINLRKVAGL